MMQIDLPLIPREVEGNLIEQRAADGYINATAMCAAAAKKFKGYTRLVSTKGYLAELSSDTGIPVEELIQVVVGKSEPKLQGSWVHPQVAIHLAQWLSPKFAVQVSKWVYEWISGGITEEKNRIPTHLQRYMSNLSEIPNTHFSMLNEITFALIAPMEAYGYTLPEHMVPDISEGQMFSKWLREERKVEPSAFPTYKHRYWDGRIVLARLYPNELLADFRAHFHNVWLPEKAEAYFKTRDQKALEFLPKLLFLPK
jgi:KilA domain-containing protein